MENNKVLKPFEKLLQLVTPFLIILLTAHTPNDNDMWWHLRSGNVMFQERIILTKDIFSFTRIGHPWVNAFWLGEIFFSVINKFSGFFGLALSASLIILCSLYFVKKQLNIPVTFIFIPLIITAFGLSPFSAVRPQLFSFLFLAILDYFLYKYKNTETFQPGFIIVLFVIWANFHGGFVWGVLLLLAFSAGEILGRLLNFTDALSWEKIWRILFISVLAILGTIVNPNGYLIWLLPLQTVNVSISGISEWASPDFHRIDLQPALLFIYILLISFSLLKKKPNLSDLIKLVGFSYMGFVSQRSLAPFLIISTPIISNSIFQVWKENISKNTEKIYKPIGSKKFIFLTTIINFTVSIFLVTLIFFQFYNLSRPSKINIGYPDQAIKWLKENELNGNLFNSYNWGGYLVYQLPEHPVFIDGRADLYGTTLINEWLEIANGTKKGIQLLDDRKINIIMLEPEWAVINKLETSGWKIYFQDEKSIILARNQ